MKNALLLTIHSLLLGIHSALLAFPVNAGLPLLALSNPDDCSTAPDISAFFTAATGVVQMSGTYDNTMATADPADPVPGCFAETGGVEPVNNSLWFTFTTNGGLFHLETIPCNTGGLYISGGDTQMAIFQGTDCHSLTQVACNEDLYVDSDPATDYRAGLTFLTVPGQTYYLMIDGYASGTIVASGQFCIQIVRVSTVTCAQATAGNYEIENNGFLCKGQNLLSVLSFDAASFVIPNDQPLSGMSWALTSQPIPPDTWPGSIPGIISTTLSTQVLPVNLQNNIISSEPMVFYFTPVVVGSATLINPDVPAKLPNLDVSSGCYILGATSVLTLVPVLEPLHGQAIVTPATAGQQNGAATLLINGGYPATVANPALYQFEWSTGDTTSLLANLAPGAYTVVVSDPSACVSNITLTADVVVPVLEPNTAFDVGIFPNPATNRAFLVLQLPEAADVEIRLLDVFGQVLQQLVNHHAQHLERTLELDNYPQGLYFLQVNAGERSAIKKMWVQR
ncbi:MAG: T9SS type A sorting domain-containing protein [Saprospiraceae bacterium]|nr:T9SS type A sorting domain-containing protein [Saprospiraceae bacterium]